MVPPGIVYQFTFVQLTLPAVMILDHQKSSKNLLISSTKDLKKVRSWLFLQQKLILTLYAKLHAYPGVLCNHTQTE